MDHPKSIKKMRKRNAWKASLVDKTADLTGLKTNYVRKVLRGDRESQKVMNVYMALWEGENTLLASVKKTLENV